jgi:hypothetical protein
MILQSEARAPEGPILPSSLELERWGKDHLVEQQRLAFEECSF